MRFLEITCLCLISIFNLVFSKHALPVKPSIVSLSSSKKVIASNTTNSIFTKVDKNGDYQLTYFGLMLSGAVARSISATAVQPLTVIKTMLQKRHGTMPEISFRVLSRGAGTQFIMSVPHGALNFAVTETTKNLLVHVTNSSLMKEVPPKYLNPAMDFLSSSVATFICSIISTPQMVLTDKIMAGQYKGFLSAIKAIFEMDGIRGFYLGWFPALVQKIPSYALTWMFFQQLKLAFVNFMLRAGTAMENLVLGSLAAAAACCVMIPVDTIKTRLVTQGKEKHYHGMIHCLQTILKEEGVWSLYRALPPRLMSVMPMIGIQFAVYELMKRLLLHQPSPIEELKKKKRGIQQVLADIKASTTSTSTATKNKINKNVKVLKNK